MNLTELDPFAADGILRLKCPHCVREGREEPDILFVDMSLHPPVDYAETTGFENLSLDGIIEIGDWKGVIKKGIVGTIVPLAGRAISVAAHSMREKIMAEMKRDADEAAGK